MAWLAVDKDGAEIMPHYSPIKVSSGYMKPFITLPKGTIFRLIGRELTWEDEPVKLTEELLVKPVEVTDEEIKSVLINPIEFSEIDFNIGFFEGAIWMRERMKR